MVKFSFLRATELELRLTPSSSMALTGSMDSETDDRTLNDMPRASAVVTIESQPKSGRVLLKIRVADWCPSCSVRISGVTRQVGDGITDAMFQIPVGARSVYLEMALDDGPYVPVMRVQFGADGQVERLLELSEGHHAFRNAQSHESLMAMPMGDHDLIMTVNTVNDVAQTISPHRSMSDGQTATGMTLHSAPIVMPGHRGSMAATANGVSNDKSMTNMPRDNRNAGHSTEEPNHFGDSAEMTDEVQSEGMHAMSTQRDETAGKGRMRSIDDEGRSFPQLIDPPIAVSCSIADTPSTESELHSSTTEGTWSIGIGGAFVSVALAAASHAIERRARSQRASRMPRVADATRPQTN